MHQNNHNHNHNHDTPFSGSKTTRRSLSHQQPPQQQSSSPNRSPSTLYPGLPSIPQKYRQNQRKSHQCISVFCPAWEQQNCDDYITLIQSQSNTSTTGISPPSTSTTNISQPFVFGTLTLVEEKVDSHIERDRNEVVKKDLDTEDSTDAQSTGAAQTIQTATFHGYTTQPTYIHTQTQTSNTPTSTTPTSTTTTTHILSHIERLSQHRAICIALPHHHPRSLPSKHNRKHSSSIHGEPHLTTKPNTTSLSSINPTNNPISNSLWDLWVSYHTGLGFYVLIYDGQRRRFRGGKYQDNPYVKYHPYTLGSLRHKHSRNDGNVVEIDEENEDEDEEETEDMVLTLTRCRFEAKVW